MDHRGAARCDARDRVWRESLSGCVLETCRARGKRQGLVREELGRSSGKSPRFFGGETWTYFRIAGGQSGAPLFNFSPNQCQITLKFSKEDKLSSYSYS